MADLGGTVDAVLADLARRSHGVVTRKQLIAAGLTRHDIERRMLSGALIRAHPGVYRVGHLAPSTEATYLAAVLACGAGSLLFNAAGGYLYGLVKTKPPLPQVLTPKDRRIEGIDTCRARRGDKPQPSTWRGVPVTNIPRTIVDLAATLDPNALAWAMHQASVRYRVTPEQIEAILDARQTKGAPQLRAVLRGDTKVLLSALERRFVEVLTADQLQLPVTNKRVGDYYVDCRWPQHRLTVELDSYRYHATRHAWEQDRRREREAYARDDQFRRYTYEDVYNEPQPMLNELRELLAV